MREKIKRNTRVGQMKKTAIQTTTIKPQQLFELLVETESALY